MGYYYEMKLPENTDKTIDEIKAIVFKNLEKDPIYYTKNGQFGVDVGYTDDVPSLGVPEEPKGKYKESGYGDIKGESDFDYVVKEGKIKKKKKPINEHTISLAGGIVTGGAWKAPTLEELLGEVSKENANEATEDDLKIEKDITAEKAKQKALEIEENIEAPYWAEELATAAESAYDEGIEISEILSFIEQHLGGKYGDY